MLHLHDRKIVTVLLLLMTIKACRVQIYMSMPQHVHCSFQHEKKNHWCVAFVDVSCSYLGEPGLLSAGVQGFPGHQGRLRGGALLGRQARLLRGRCSKQGDAFLKGRQLSIPFQLHVKIGTVVVVRLLKLQLLGSRLFPLWVRSLSLDARGFLRSDRLVHRFAFRGALLDRGFWWWCCRATESLWMKQTLVVK